MKKGTASKIVIFMILLWSSISLWAQGDGGQAGAFLRYGVGGRALGMGRAFTAVSDDASGIYWNPSGILGANRVELTSMYSNLFFDSQYAYFGVVFPRFGKNVHDRVGRFLVGPSSAIGFGWVGLSTTNFQQRTITGAYLGDFGISENAFLFSWAREEASSWGLFRYGVNFKFVNQNYPGLESASSMSFSEGSDWSGGMDIGFSFLPIHAPIFKIVSLRYLLPLRFGVSFQNVLQPSYRSSQGKRDPFPRVFRWGVSYKWIIRDWLPSSWEGFRRFIGAAQILLAFDREHYKGAETGNYFGVEGYIPIHRNGFIFYPRAGINNRTEGTSIGAGLAMPFAKSAQVRLDYVYGMHPDLPADNRFFLTVKMGSSAGAQFFDSQSRQPDLSRKEVRNNLLRVLTEYPNRYVADAVTQLAESEDTTNARRYYDLTGGLGRADILFAEAKQYLKQGNVSKARKKALEATREYMPIFRQPEHTLNDQNLTNFGEALIIAGRMEESILVLQEVERPALRNYYLLGAAKKGVKDWDGAIEEFRNAVRQYREEQDRHSMVCLSFLGLGESLIKKEQYQSALTTLEVLLKNYSRPLDSDYPRYPIFTDNHVVDDAQFLVGICHLLMKQSEDGIAEILKTERFYPQLEYGQFVNENAETLIDILGSEDWDRLDTISRRFVTSYDQTYDNSN